MEEIVSSRLPRGIDDELAELLRGGSAMIAEKIQTVSTIAPLYRRPLTLVSGHSVSIEEENGSQIGCDADGYGIVVKQFNMLAEGLSAAPETRPPFPAKEVNVNLVL